jgi:D-xylose transport system substrate-binding protein
MSKRSLAAVGAVALSLLLAACGSSSTPSSSSGGSSSSSTVAVGVILPDTASSKRWENNDRPLLQAAFDAAGVKADIQNAQGDKSKWSTLCDQFINEGVKVMVVVNLDSDTAKACESKAGAQGIKTIDYDRYTIGGSASYYVSFDNIGVGTLEGQGLVKCMQANGKTSGPVALLNGSPTDNNATLFKQGYEAAIKSAGYTIAADQAVPEWNNTQGGVIFEQMYTKAGGNFVGVDAANDGLGGAVVAVLQKNGLAGKVPVTGQDATNEGLQRVLLGTQCVTVYKAIKKEADAASGLAIALATGKEPAGVADSTPYPGQTKPSVLLTPQAIYQDSVKDVVADGFTTVADVCTTPELVAACAKYGVK